MLQQYGLGTKDINMASVQTIASLTSVLSCKAEDLLELHIETDVLLKL